MNYGSNMNEKSIAVILPCAGEGRRLGLDYPKELYQIHDKTKLIDFSLRHIRVFLDSEAYLSGSLDFHIIVVIRPGKEKVYEYVNDLFPDITVDKVMFNNDYREWPGSVYSANSIFQDYNLVFLPDNYLKFHSDNIYMNEKGNTIIGSALARMDQFTVIFGYISCDQSQTLASLGALKVGDDNRVIDFQDKPDLEYERYNAFWGCYGFRKGYGARLYGFLINSLDHKLRKKNESQFFPFGAFKIEAHFDLGTWESIKNFRDRKG